MNFPQKGSHVGNAFGRVLSGDSELQALPGADSQVNGAGTVLAKFIKGQVFTDGCIGMDLDAVSFQILYFRIQNLAGQTMFGNSSTGYRSSRAS